MFYQALAIDWIIEEQFWNRDLLSMELEFMRLIQMGILDGREGYNLPMMASMLVMMHGPAVSMRLWVMFANEWQRVGLFVDHNLCKANKETILGQSS